MTHASRRRRPAALLLVVLVLAAAPSLIAQGLDGRFGTPTPKPLLSRAAAALSVVPTTVERQPLREKTWARPVASLLVPGSGQLLAGHAHGLMYVAAEVWLVARAVALNRRGTQQAGSYRDLAFEIARRGFAATRSDGPFEYYEAMERFVESGAYDTGGGSFTPESDSTTFNGSVWALARRTFLANPDSLPAPDSPAYLAAISFYQAHAVQDEFRWSWRNARLEQDVFRATIRSSDAAFQRRTNYLGVLVLNHLVSAVDALIGSRIGHRAALPRIGFGAMPDTVVVSWRLEF